MANIRPFRAYRPRMGLEDKIAALPYDVYSREEAYKVVRENPYSFLSIDRAETSFGLETDTYAPEVYERAGSLLKARIADRDFVKENTPCYYLYRQTMNGMEQTGFVACASIDDYLTQVIKKHENTRPEKELDRIMHVDACNMQTGPIFLAYRTDDRRAEVKAAAQSLSQIMEKVSGEEPLYDFQSEDGIGHCVWKIAEETLLAAISRAFLSIPDIYIADGHHRCASAVQVGLKRRKERLNYTGEEEFNYFLAVLFPENELHIMAYNRVVKDLNGLSKEEFLEKISAHFAVERVGKAAVEPREKGTFGMYLDEDWYVLRAGEEIKSDDAVDGLDVSILQKYLFDEVLGIQDPKTDNRIAFVGGVRGLAELERRVHTDMKAAFSMYPTSISELFAVADENRLMPPKSTWFEPKLRSGLFLHDLENS